VVAYFWNLCYDFSIILIKIEESNMDQKKLLQAKNALQSIAKHEGISIEEVKKEITNAILIGMQNHNPKVQNY